MNVATNATSANASTDPPFQDPWSNCLLKSGDKTGDMRLLNVSGMQWAKLRPSSPREPNSCAAAACTSVRGYVSGEREGLFFLTVCVRQSVKDRKAIATIYAAPPTPQFLCFCRGLLTPGKQMKKIRNALLLAPLRGKRWEWDEREQDGTTQLKIVLFLLYLPTGAGGK